MCAAQGRLLSQRCEILGMIVLYLAEGPILNKSMTEFASGS